MAFDLNRLSGRQWYASRDAVIFSTIALVVILVTSPSAVHAQRASSSDASPTPMEQALMEHACRVPGQAQRPQDAYDACLAAELTALRNDFGRDLQRLAAKDRRRIDATCADLRIMRGRDAYIACLSDELQAIRHTGAQALPSEVARGSTAEVEAASSADVQPLAGSADADASTAPPSGGRSWSIWLVALGLLAGASGGGWWFLSGRAATPARRSCRACGTDVDGHGELCGSCRHEAAESQRRAIAEQSERERAVADQARRAREEAEARATQATEAERERQALLREAELARQQEAARRREEETRSWQQAAAAALVPQADEPVTDPYGVLGLPPTASELEVHFAYQEAIAKYAPAQAADLGEELQNLYKAKTKIVQQAYEMLTTPAQSH